MARNGCAEGFTGTGWMAAQAADLAPWSFALNLKRKSLPTHGAQKAARAANAEVATHLAGVRPEVARVGDRDELHHLTGVAAVQRLDDRNA